MTLKNSYHFIAVDSLLKIEADTTFSSVYKQLSAKQEGGGFLINVGTDNIYVKARELATMVLHQAIAEVLLERGLSEDELQDVSLKMKDVMNTPIRMIVETAKQRSPLIPVHREPTLISAEETALQEQYARVFDVRESGQTIGWYLNHESVRDTTTRKTIFICGNNPSHENSDPDHGTCNYCPFPIIDTRDA